MSGTTQATDTKTTPVSTKEDDNELPGVAIGVIVVGVVIIGAIIVYLVIRRYRKNKEQKAPLENTSCERRDSLFDVDDNMEIAIQGRVQNMEAQNSKQGVDNSGFYQTKATRKSVVRTPSEVVVPKKAIFKRNAYSTENIPVASSVNFGSRAATKEDITFVY